MSEEKVTDEKNFLTAMLPKIVMVLVAVGLISGVTSFVISKKPEVLGLSKGQAAVNAEVDKLIAEVGKLIALPTDEKPTVATVSDAEKIKEQAFFKNAQNGDKVLIYTSTRKVILYRPSNKQIVDVGAVNIRQQPTEGVVAGDATAEETSDPTPTPKATPKASADQ